MKYLQNAYVKFSAVWFQSADELVVLAQHSSMAPILLSLTLYQNPGTVVCQVLTVQCRVSLASSCFAPALTVSCHNFVKLATVKGELVRDKLPCLFYSSSTSTRMRCVWFDVSRLCVWCEWLVRACLLKSKQKQSSSSLSQDQSRNIVDQLQTRKATLVFLCFVIRVSRL